MSITKDFEAGVTGLPELLDGRAQSYGGFYQNALLAERIFIAFMAKRCYSDDPSANSYYIGAAMHLSVKLARFFAHVEQETTKDAVALDTAIDLCGYAHITMRDAPVQRATKAAKLSCIENKLVDAFMDIPRNLTTAHLFAACKDFATRYLVLYEHDKETLKTYMTGLKNELVNYNEPS